jgi:serine/threonine protein kinase
VIAYIVLSGTEPFTGDNDMETAQRTKEGDYSFDGEEWDKVSPMAKRFIERCLHPDPAKRPSATELLAHPWLNPNPNGQGGSSDEATPLGSFKKAGAAGAGEGAHSHYKMVE